MIAQTFDYAAPSTLEEALALLANQNAKVLAGGMSLIPMMKLRFAAPEQLVDIGRITNLNYICEENAALHIGATVTHQQIESSLLLREKCPLLPETASHIGDLQVRNMGTLGGSTAHADPAADYPASLQALEAKIRLVSASGERTLDAADFFVDTLTTALEPGELLLEVVLPIEEPGTAVHYEKVVHPASGYAVVGVAVRLRKSDGKIAFARVGITGLAGKSFRAVNVEQALHGTGGAPADVSRAAALVAQGVDANSDLFASAGYRMHLAQVHTARALSSALSRLS